MRARSRGHMVGLLCSIVLGCCAAATSGYTFKKIAESGDGFQGFGSAGGGINAGGEVAFSASLPDNGPNGIHKGSGGPVTTIAVGGGTFSNQFVNGPAINDSGVVAFTNNFTGNPSGIFTSSGNGVITTIATTADGGAFGTLWVSYPRINAGGAVVFPGTLRNGQSGIFVGSGGALTTIVAANRPLGNFGFVPGINDHGTVAFQVSAGPGFESIHTGNGGALTTIADTKAGEFIRFTLGATINNAGAVAFGAGLATGGSAVMLYSGGSLQKIATSSGDFDLLGVPAMNDAGSIAFQRTLPNGDVGIFTGPDFLADKVIRVGDPLFGSTVTYVGMSPGGMNDAGDIAFVYILADKRLGVAVAEVPEPQALAALLVCSLLTARRRRKVDSPV